MKNFNPQKMSATQNYVIRDLTPMDYDICRELVQEELYRALFATTDIEELHTKCAYASVACTKDNEVVAFLMSAYQPQFFHGLDQSCQPAEPPGTLCPNHYNDYLQKHYELRANEFLTQFVRLTGCQPHHQRAFGFLLQSYFNFDPRHELLLFVLYPYCTLPAFVGQAFPELQREAQLPTSACYVHACPRAHILAPLKVEPAQMKDNDDIVLIFDAQNAQLKKRFENEFFIADMIRKAADSEDKLAVLGSDFEVNSTEIYTPVAFLYVERQQPFDDNFGGIQGNLKVTHQLEKYGLDKIAPNQIAFARAMACLPQAESRCGDLLAYVFEQWDVEALFLSMPSSASTDMQLIRMFTLIDPQSPLSPRESLFVCHRDSWLGSVHIMPIKEPNYLNQMKDYLRQQLQGSESLIFPAKKYPTQEKYIATDPEKAEQLEIQLKKDLEDPELIHNKLQILSPDSEFGTMVAYGYIKGRMSPIALCLVDLRIGRLNDSVVLKEYIASYQQLSLKESEGRIQKGDFSVQQVLDNIKDKTENYETLQQTLSMYEPSTCLTCRTWCKIHYDEDISKYGFLKCLFIDPLFLQFSEDITAAFMRRSGVDGFLMQIGHKQQEFIKPVYVNDKFQDVSCDPSQILSSFEKELFRGADFVQRVNILRNPTKTYYDGQFGANYGMGKKVIEQVPSYQNSMYDADSQLHQDRLNDGQQFNQKAKRDFEQDVMLSAIRSLNPEFGLYVIRPQNLLQLYRPPIQIANPEDSAQIIVKPAQTITDRLVILGFGLGLLATLQTLQSAHHLAKFKSITIVHPPPGPVFSFNFDKLFEYKQIYDHGESMPEYRDRAINLFYDVFIGDVNEILIGQGILKLASGVELGFDTLMICPDGADSESLRQIPHYNYNYSVSYNYGIVDPGSQGTQVIQAGPEKSKLNDRGYLDPEIYIPLSDNKNYCWLLSSLYSEKLYHKSLQQQDSNMQSVGNNMQMIAGKAPPARFASVHTEQDLDCLEVIKQRLHARTFFRYLSRDHPLLKKQLAALNCSTYLENFNVCVQQLFSQQKLKQMKAEAKAREVAVKAAKSGQPIETITDTDQARQQQQDSESNATASTNGYRLLSPGSRTSQFIQIMNPEVQAELPLLLQRMAEVVMEARRQLFPTLYNPRPPKAGNESIQTVVCSIVDVSRTSIGIIGDTFESLAIVQGLLDAGVPADSIILMLPQDPNADIDPLIQKQENMIEHLLNPGNFCKTKPRANCNVPGVLASINKELKKDTAALDSKSTSQIAEKRIEAYPQYLHSTLLFNLQKLGVNVLHNVKIQDILCTQSTSSKKTMEAGEDGQNQDQNAENKSEEGEEDDDESEGEMDEMDEQNIDDIEANTEITPQMIADACETLNQLNEADIVLCKKRAQFGSEPEILDNVIDQILMGNTAEVMNRLMDGNVEIKKQELDNQLRKRIIYLSMVVSKNLRRKRNKKYRKIGNGEALCGLRLKMLRPAGANDHGFQEKANIQPGKPRIVVGPPPNCTSMQIQLNQNDQNVAPNQGVQPGSSTIILDVFVCALFMSESFSVPNNLSYALMRSDLVFDKALIINSYGQTSQSKVYASGNIGKLSRATLLKKLQMQGLEEQQLPRLPLSPVLLTTDPVKPVVTWNLYSSHETAEYATFQCLKQRLTQSTDVPYLIPEFTRPLILSAKVTGGFVFRVSRPLRDIRDQRFVSQKLFRSLETGDCPPKAGERWCRLEIDPLGIVDSFCVYGCEELHPDYKELVYKCIGLPISLFDQVEQRRQKGQSIPDLLDFLCQYQIQVLFDPKVIVDLNKILVECISSTRFQTELENTKRQVDSDANSLADLKGETVAADAGTKLLKSADNWVIIKKLLVDTAAEIANRVSERFYELGRDADQRGKIVFK